MQWRKPHPWDPGYAIPKYIMSEPARFQTHTTSQQRRRSYGPLGVRPPGWQHGLSLPEYIQKEQVGQGALRTKYAPRRTVSTLIPQYLGDDAPAGPPAGPNDAIAKFGEKMSILIMGSVMRLPPKMRKPALKSLFDQLDPELWGLVSRKAGKLASEGMAPGEALEKSIAASTSVGLLKEIIRMGESKLPTIKSMSGLAVYGDSAQAVVLSGYMDSMQALGFCGPICLAEKAASALKTAAKATGSALVTAGSATGGAVWTGAGWVGGKMNSAGQWVGGKASGAAGAVWDFGSNVLGKAADLACSVLSSSAGQMAAGAGSAALGAPPQVGMAGAQLGASLCSSPAAAAAAAEQAAALEESKFPTLLVVGGGVAALGLVFFMTRKK